MPNIHEIGSLVVYIFPYDIVLSHSIGLILNFALIPTHCLVLWSKPDLSGLKTSWHALECLVVVKDAEHARQISRSRSGGLGHLK